MRESTESAISSAFSAIHPLALESSFFDDQWFLASVKFTYKGKHNLIIPTLLFFIIKFDLYILCPTHVDWNMTVTSVNNEYYKAPKSQQRKCLDLRLFDAYGKSDANIFSLKMVLFHGDESHGIPIRIKVTQKTNPMQFIGCIFQTWVEFQGVEAWSLDQKSILQNAATSKTSWWFQPIWKILVKLEIMPK